MRSNYSTGKPEVDAIIDQLAAKHSSHGNKEYMRQILTTVLKLYFDKANQGDLKIINTSLKEMRHAFRVFAPYRDIRKVVVWGSARAKKSTPEYKMSREFCKKIAKKGFMVITGGGGGVMEAGNIGAGDKGFGINIELPMEQHPNRFVKGKRMMTFHYFFTRKLIFVKESDATVLFPGGFGTNDEAFEILTLAQTGKTMPRPIVFVDSKGCNYWKNWLKFVKHDMVKGKFISDIDFGLFKLTCSVDEAIKATTDFYKNYHSIRFVGPITVMRLNKQLTKKQIDLLNKKFSDILVKGRITSSKPHAEEIKDRDLVSLPRLCFNFNKHDFGRLYEMIGVINGF